MASKMTKGPARLGLGTALLAATVAGAVSAEPTEIKVWRHHEGAEDELQANIEAMDRFNASQDRWKVVSEVLPQKSYTEAVTAAALAGQLPCAFDMDHPTVPNFAWSGHVVPIGDRIPQETIDAVKEGATGSYKGNLYSIGQFDVALALFTRQSTLDQYGIRKATMDEPYTLEEFNEILAKLKESGDFEFPFDVKSQWSGEWWSYAFGPWLASFGGDLIDRGNYWYAEGVLNGEAGVAFGEWFQGLFDDGLAQRTPADDKGFIQGRVAIDYNGSWAIDDYTSAVGDDLVIMPVPDFGNGPKIGAASWQWGISKSCEHPEGAGEYISFIMTPPEVAAMSTATGLMPVTDAAAALTEHYKEGGDWRIFYEYSKAFALVRPETPAYPVITSSFERAMTQIRDGADVQDSLDEAVDTIERDIRDNAGYGFPEP